MHKISHFSRFATQTVFAITLLFVGAVSAHAQVTTPNATTSPIPPSNGVVNCFDYYKFGSVVAYISPENETVGTGMLATFSGSIKNDNTYPIVDGAVYVKIFKKQENATLTQENGGLLVDQFFAQKGIVVGANQSIPFSFQWKVPAYAYSGDYYAVTYFETQDEFNLSGLSFTDDIFGNTADFKVVGNISNGVSLNRNTVAVNVNSYLFASFIPTFSATSSVIVSFDVVNDTNKQITVPVSYKLYSWDALTENNLITTSNDLITVSPASSKRVPYTITDQTKSVYYLVIESDYKDTKSLLDIRFGRQGIDNPRINFPSTNSYPLKKNVPASVFMCVQNGAPTDIISSSTISLKVFDDKNNLLNRHDYVMPLTSAMIGLKNDFTPTKDLKDFSVEATISNGGRIVDHSIVTYKCTDLLSASSCNRSSFSDFLEKYVYLYILGILIIIILLVVLVVKKIIQVHRGVALLLFVLLIGSYQYVLYKPVSVVAQSEATTIVTDGITWNKTFPTIYMYNMTVWPVNGPSQTLWVDGLNVQVGYWGKVYDVTNPANPVHLMNGSSVFVGTHLKFVPGPFDNADIVWYITGGWLDTPNGYWNSVSSTSDKWNSTIGWLGSSNSNNWPPQRGYIGKANWSANMNTICLTDFSPSDLFHFDTFPMYFPTVVQPPTTSIIQRGTALLTNNGDGTYTVSGPGSIIADIVFSSTPGRGKIYRLFLDPDLNDKNPIGCSLAYTNNFTVPSMVVTKNISAVATSTTTTNNPPSIPIINITSSTTNSVSCMPAGGTLDSTIYVSSTDINNDQIYYSVNIDGVVTRVPGTGTVPSDTTLSVSKTWSIDGSHSIAAQAIDTNGIASTWSTYSLNIPDCSTTPTVNNSAPTISCNDGSSLGTVQAGGGSKTASTNRVLAGGGTIPYLYRWNPNSTIGTWTNWSSSDATLSYSSITATTTYSVYVQAEDSANATSSQIVCGTVTVNGTSSNNNPTGNTPTLWIGSNQHVTTTHIHPGNNVTLGFDWPTGLSCKGAGSNVGSNNNGWTSSTTLESTLSSPNRIGSFSLSSMQLGIYTLNLACLDSATPPNATSSNSVEIDVTPSSVQEL